MTRQTFLTVPLDEIDQESAIRALRGFLTDGGRHQIVLLSAMGVLKARKDPEYRRCLQDASLVLPVSRFIATCMRFIGLGHPPRFSAFEFVVRLLAAAEDLDKTVYLLGSRKGILERAERGLRASFPRLKLVGRFSGFYDRSMEESITLVIRKSSPTLLLVGTGVPGNDLWIQRHKNGFHPGVFIWIENGFEVLSGRENPSARLRDLLRRPWRLARLFCFAHLTLLVLANRITHQSAATE